ncbi:MAG: TspO/MBR family protein [Alphaproteobacteria bacterium]
MSATLREWTALLVLVTIALVLPWAVQTVGVPDWNTWYQSLERPAWTPPRWAFPVVWPILYVMMSVAAWLVWRRAGWDRGGFALGLFGVQFVVNAAWTWVFGGLKSLSGAFWWILLLWILIAATIMAFRRHSGVAAALLLPYLAWVTFAAALSYAIWQLNAGRPGF